MHPFGSDRKGRSEATGTQHWQTWYTPLMSRSLSACAVLVLAAIAGPVSGQERPNLSGYWVLKVDLPAAADSAPSDSTATDSTATDSTATDSAATASTATDSTVTDSTAADSTPVGPPSDLRPVIRRRGSPAEQQQLNRLVGMASPVAAVRITQTDTTITFLNDGGFTYVVRPNGKRDSILDGETAIWVRARWRGRALEIEYRPPGGGRLIETYELADSKTYLRLEVVVEHDVLAQRLWRPRMYRLEESP